MTNFNAYPEPIELTWYNECHEWGQNLKSPGFNVKNITMSLSWTGNSNSTDVIIGTTTFSISGTVTESEGTYTIEINSGFSTLSCVLIDFGDGAYDIISASKFSGSPPTFSVTHEYYVSNYYNKITLVGIDVYGNRHTQIVPNYIVTP